MKTKDWWPTARTGQLAMAKKWVEVITPAADLWSIAPETIESFKLLADEAEEALTLAQNEATRTPVATARCRDVFAKLTDAARDMKKRRFLTPPLENPDLIALGLKPPDRKPTPSGAPTAQAAVETYLIGRRELGLRIVYLTGSPDSAENKGYRIYYSVVRNGETPPTSPDELRKSFFTKRKKDVLSFSFADSGSVCYMAVQIENDGKKGSWGPLTSALIP